MHIGVWRSLVARLNGVQEAASSNLVTPTNAGFACRGTKKESPLLGLSYFLSPIFARLLFICLTRLFEIVTLSSFAIPSDAHAAQYKCISPYPIGVRYSVVRQNLPLSLRFARPYESSHSDQRRAAHFGARKKGRRSSTPSSCAKSLANFKFFASISFRHILCLPCRTQNNNLCKQPTWALRTRT